MVQVREYLRSTIRQIYQGTTPEALKQRGMDILLGAVSFVDPHTLNVGSQQITAKKILIATGAVPVLPSLPGLNEVSFSTYRQIFENDRLSDSMVVIGGGPVGVEVAQAYQRLGTRVTILAERLLPKEELDASAILLRVLQREGLHIVAERALSVARSGNRTRVHSRHHQVECDLLFGGRGAEAHV